MSCPRVCPSSMAGRVDILVWQVTGLLGQSDGGRTVEKATMNPSRTDCRAHRRRRQNWIAASLRWCTASTKVEYLRRSIPLLPRRGTCCQSCPDSGPVPRAIVPPVLGHPPGQERGREVAMAMAPGGAVVVLGRPCWAFAFPGRPRRRLAAVSPTTSCQVTSYMRK